jgi:L-lysine exporter family protein LysE/ArgO
VSAAPALLAAAAGFGLGLSLIVAIGAQNAFVLRQGLRGAHVGAVVAVCIVSDAALIVAGIAGVGALLTRVSWLIGTIRIIGAGFLLVYGVLAARRALRPGVLAPDEQPSDPSLAAVVGTCLALTWLNPHVYLDTVLLLGSIASTHGSQRWSFGAGAAVASAVWFLLLGYGARLLRPVFARPVAWRVLDAVIAVVMIAIAASLVIAAAR